MAKVGLNLGLNRCLQTTKNHKIKKVATFVTTSFIERKTGLKPATPKCIVPHTLAGLTMLFRSVMGRHKQILN